MGVRSFFRQAMFLAEDTQDPFKCYFDCENISYSQATHKKYGFFCHLSECRFQSVRIELIDRGEILDVIAELPVYVNRRESDGVLVGLMEINRTLDENCCYELDLISGTLRFRMQTDMPKDSDGIENAIDQCEKILFSTDDRLMKVLCKTILSENGTQKIDFRNGAWQEVGSEAVYSYDQLKEKLKSAEKQVIVLEGPGGCGKSTLIREFMNDDKIPSCVFPVDRLQDSIVERIGGSESTKLEKALTGYKRICIEDVDWGLKALYQQVEAGRLIRKLSENALVILNGVSCTENAAALLEQTDPTIYRFVEKQK